MREKGLKMTIREEKKRKREGGIKDDSKGRKGENEREGGELVR